VGTDAHLHALSWQGQGAVRHENLTRGANAIRPGGRRPAAFLDSKRGVNIVVYRARDNHIRSIYWSDGPSGMDDLSGYAHTPDPASDPAACYVVRHDAHYVVYRAADGHIYLLQWYGEAPVFGIDLTAASSAPAAVGDPYIWDNASANRHHVVYRGKDKHVHDLSWAPGAAPQHLDLCAAALSHPAGDAVGRQAGGGDPIGFDGPTHQHVVYVGMDGHIHEIRWIEEPISLSPDERPRR
jgi:hypothetical protein